MPVSFLDIVATQGAYLIPRAGTPVFEKTYDKEFAALLFLELRALVTAQICRRNMYREAADEWPMGRTPPELKEKRKAELKALEECEGASDGSDSDNNSGGADGKVGPEKDMAISSQLQAHWLPTPPLSADGQVLAHIRTKRRRISFKVEAEDEEKERSTKDCVTTSPITTRIRPGQTPLADGSQRTARKRRRTYDVNDEREETEERPAKTDVTASRTSKRLQTLRAAKLRRLGNGSYRYSHNKAIKFSETMGLEPTPALRCDVFIHEADCTSAQPKNFTPGSRTPAS